MPGYRLTTAAEQDLAGIWDYSFEIWGADQADRYLEQLAACCDRIADGQPACKSFPEIDARLKSYRCQQHYIFFLAKDDAAIIIAVLHERMDLMARLARRLD